ncbi:MAG: 3-oxoacyl-[acyl-carrier protein] reductase [Halobacteriales archaeon]|jgi:3-oxoacyl-[acyl-carrier protein] reductase
MGIGKTAHTKSGGVSGQVSHFHYKIVSEFNVVVTGASRGIGAAVASRFGADGARVTICARTAEDLTSVAESIRTNGGNVTVVEADVSDVADVEKVMDAATEEADTIDLLVANAGVYHGTPGETPLRENDYETFDEHFEINARGVFATIREGLPSLAPGARILVPSGSVARESKGGVGSYAVSKAAAEAIVRGFAAELDQTVTVVDPGQVSTDLMNGATGRDPDEIANMFHWVATAADPNSIDGDVVDLRTWRTATR